MKKVKIEKETIKNAASKGKGFIGEFKSFIEKGNVMDMAIGIIIGTQFSNIVQALTNDFINPLIHLIGTTEVKGKIKLSNNEFIDYGDFISTVINFVLMAFVLFMMLKVMNKIMHKKKEEKEVIVIKDDKTKVLEEIRDLLKERK